MILMGFALGGALQCSGLAVQPQSVGRLEQDFASDFTIADAFETMHRTSEAGEQLFHVAVLRRRALQSA